MIYTWKRTEKNMKVTVIPIEMVALGAITKGLI